MHTNLEWRLESLVKGVDVNLVLILPTTANKPIVIEFEASCLFYENFYPPPNQYHSHVVRLDKSVFTLFKVTTLHLFREKSARY